MYNYYFLNSYTGMPKLIVRCNNIINCTIFKKCRGAFEILNFSTLIK